MEEHKMVFRPALKTLFYPSCVCSQHSDAARRRVQGLECPKDERPGSPGQMILQ